MVRSKTYGLIVCLMISVTRKPRVIPWVRPLWICLRPRPQVTTVWNTDMWVEHVEPPNLVKIGGFFVWKFTDQWQMIDWCSMSISRYLNSKFWSLLYLWPLWRFFFLLPYLFLRKKKTPHIFMVISWNHRFSWGIMFVDFVGYPYPQIMFIKEINWLAL